MSSPREVTLIPGDGIGPANTDATVRLLEAPGASIAWDRQIAGMAAVKALGDPLPEATLESIRRTKLALKGPLETALGKGFRSINVALRKTFDLYANVRPAKSVLPGLRFDGVDIVLVRENTDGLYIGVENYIKVGTDEHAAAQSIAVVTRYGAERIHRYACEYAIKHGRKKVTMGISTGKRSTPSPCATAWGRRPRGHSTCSPCRSAAAFATTACATTSPARTAKTAGTIWR